MDPIYNLNQTRLTENTQRSSDNLRIQRNKEVKEKSKRAGEIEEAELPSDLSNMSEDMLGDMDPDSYGGGAQAYQRAWEEEEEEPKPKEREGGEGSSDQEPREERGQSQEEPEPREEAPVAGIPLERPPEAVPVRAESKPEAPSAATPAPAAPAASPSRPSLDMSKLSVPGTGAAPSIFFDLSAGFFIAEEFQPEETEPEAAGSLGEAEAVPEVAPELADLLEKLIIGDMGCPAYRKLQLLLSRFGRGVLRLCLEKGTKVYLLPRESPLQSHPLLASCLSGDAVDAAYLMSARACVIEDRCLNRAPVGFQPVLYYFAFAFDHALGAEEFASVRSPAVNASYQACLDGPHRFADPMAALSTVHYFAQAVESYLSENDSLDPVWSRQDLYDFDRSMFEYVDYLFKRQNKP